MIRRRAFTLFELMIVIAIIFILLAIIFPLIHASVETARRTTCASNMRQLHAAYVQYCAANDGLLFPCDNLSMQAGSPRFNETYDMPGLTEFAGDSRVFHCPSDLNRPGYRSYSVNEFLGGTYGAFVSLQWGRHFGAFRYLRDVIDAHATFLWIEEVPSPRKNGRTGGFVVYPYPKPVIVDQPAALHEGGTWITFVDGHCEFWKWLDSRTTAPNSQAPPILMRGNPDIIRLQRIEGTDNVPGTPG
jgi:prepilin-type N-terminal cleavage/methylation domain-containing protein